MGRVQCWEVLLQVGLEVSLGKGLRIPNPRSGWDWGLFGNGSEGEDCLCPPHIVVTTKVWSPHRPDGRCQRSISLQPSPSPLSFCLLPHLTLSGQRLLHRVNHKAGQLPGGGVTSSQPAGWAGRHPDVREPPAPWRFPVPWQIHFSLQERL